MYKFYNAKMAVGTLADRPSFSTQMPFFYFASDVNKLYIWTGEEWQQIQSKRET